MDRASTIEDPRVVHTRQVVLEAARDLLVSEGRDAVTPLRIAERTGIARTTIYRHWPDQTNLLIDTIESFTPYFEFEPSGDLRQDLIALMIASNRSHDDVPVLSLFATMLELAEHSDEIASFMRRMNRQRTVPLRRMLAAAIERGELRSDLNPADAVSMLVGPVFLRRLIDLQSLDDAFVERIVDNFLRGALPD